MRRLPLTAVLIAFAACEGRRDSDRPLHPEPPPPTAEFLVAAGDSTYWVSTSPAGIRLRGSPLLLAMVAGRYQEVYVADDDRSYDDAVFLGQRIYRRDLVTDDSTVVIADTVVPRLARQYASAHPRAHRLAPDEPGSDDPGVSATAEIDVLDLHGSHLSYDYGVEMTVRREPVWHRARRGVVDLRTGRAERVSDLVDDTTAERVMALAKADYRSLRDSVLLARGARARRAARALTGFHFDETSFAVTTLGAEPAFAFVAPVDGDGPAGVTLPFAPIFAGHPRWWSDVRTGLPTSSEGDSLDRWHRSGYDVLARYDGDRVRLAIADAAREEWKVGTLLGPVHQIFWLDSPGVDTAQRRGLRRAFEEATLYDENTRTAAAPSPRTGPSGRTAARPARVVLASRHDRLVRSVPRRSRVVARSGVRG